MKHFVLLHSLEIFSRISGPMRESRDDIAIMNLIQDFMVNQLSTNNETGEEILAEVMCEASKRFAAVSNEVSYQGCVFRCLILLLLLFFFVRLQLIEQSRLRHRLSVLQEMENNYHNLVIRSVNDSVPLDRKEIDDLFYMFKVSSLEKVLILHSFLFGLK